MHLVGCGRKEKPHRGPFLEGSACAFASVVSSFRSPSSCGGTWQEYRGLKYPNMQHRGCTGQVVSGISPLLLFLSSELLTFRNCFPFNSFVLCSTVQCFTLSGHSRAQRALPEEPRHNGKGFSLGSRHIPEKELYLGQVFPQVSTGNAE